MLAVILLLQVITLLLIWFLLKGSVDLAAKFSTSHTSALKSLTESAARMEAAAAVVAKNLSISQGKADSVPTDKPGEAADAFSKTP